MIFVTIQFGFYFIDIENRLPIDSLIHVWHETDSLPESEVSSRLFDFLIIYGYLSSIKFPFGLESRNFQIYQHKKKLVDFAPYIFCSFTHLLLRFVQIRFSFVRVRSCVCVYAWILALISYFWVLSRKR